MDNNYNFPVALQPIFLEDSRKIADRKAVVRTDTMQTLGIVSDDYGLVKHGTVVDTFREAGRAYSVEEKVSLTNNGGNLFYEMLFPKVEGEVAKGDIIRMRMIIKNSYNGLNSLQIIFGALRLVCLNGMVIGSKFFAFSYRHIGNVQGLNENNMAETLQLQDRFAQYVNLFGNSMKDMSVMAKQQIGDDKGLFEKEQVNYPQYLLDEARSSYENKGDTTVWGYYNALTFAATHKLRKPNPQTGILFGTEAWKAAQRVRTGAIFS